MEQINQEAWDILNTDEQTAITLSLGYNKSTWESGEILKKAHFKYLEIQKRAMKFLEMFTHHFERYGGLFPEGLYIPDNLKEYLCFTILDRYNISKAINNMEDPNYLIASRRNKLIIREITKLAESKDPKALDLYGIIMDFDRWNNFRILPIEIQEPSAFKRRNKSRHIKHLNNIITLPQFSVLKIVEKYSYTGKYRKMYFGLISRFLPEGYKVVEARYTKQNFKDISNIGLFIFSDHRLATELSKLISHYFLSDKKTCKLGQKFWPKFRELVVLADNHDELENIHRSRTFLDKAIFEKKPKKREKSKRVELERVKDDKLFYQGMK